MPIYYSQNKLIPVPSCNIQKAYLRTGAGELRRPVWKITVNGYLSLHKGSPLYDGTFWTTSGYPADTPSLSITEDSRLAILRTKKGALANLFSEQGKLFEIQPYDGSASIKFVPRVQQINFDAEANWVQFVKYTIEMECEIITFGTTEQAANELGDDDVQESWQIEPSDEKQRTFKMTHTVVAQANDYYDPAGTGTLVSAGWEKAKEKAVFHLGTASSSIAAAYPSFDLSFYGVYNHALQENIDEGEGRYSATETWLLYPGAAYIEDYTVNSRRSLTDGQVTVSIEGTVTGFSTTEGFGDRYTNADAGWSAVFATLYTRAQTVSGVTLNSSPFNYSVGRNPNQGVITYNYEYNNRFAGLITGSLTENLSVQDSLVADIFAIHRVVARPSGPILQDIITNTEQRRTLTITANMPPATTVGLASPPNGTEIGNIAATYTPTGANQGPYIERNEQTFDYWTGRYTRFVTWIWT